MEDRGDERIVKNVFKKHRTVFEAIGLPIPERVWVDMPIHTQEEVGIPKREPTSLKNRISVQNLMQWGFRPRGLFRI